VGDGFRHAKTGAAAATVVMRPLVAAKRNGLDRSMPCCVAYI
jgi:hypothetical protein